MYRLPTRRSRISRISGVNVVFNGVARLVTVASIQTLRDPSAFGTFIKLLITGNGWRQGSIMLFDAHLSVVSSITDLSDSGNFFL